MNPIILYPKTAAQVKLLRKTAEEQGVEVVGIPQQLLEEIDDLLFIKQMVERDKTAKAISNEELDATFERLLNDK